MSDKETALNNPAVKEAVAKIDAELEGDGRVLLRKSGTEPVLRIMVEASTDEICDEKIEDIIKVMKSENLIVEVK